MRFARKKICAISMKTVCGTTVWRLTNNLGRRGQSRSPASIYTFKSGSKKKSRLNCTLHIKDDWHDVLREQNHEFLQRISLEYSIASTYVVSKSIGQKTNYSVYKSSFKSIPNDSRVSFNSVKYAWYCSLFSTLCFNASNVLTAVG